MYSSSLYRSGMYNPVVTNTGTYTNQVVANTLRRSGQLAGTVGVTPRVNYGGLYTSGMVGYVPQVQTVVPQVQVKTESPTKEGTTETQPAPSLQTQGQVKMAYSPQRYVPGYRAPGVLYNSSLVTSGFLGGRVARGGLFGSTYYRQPAYVMPTQPLMEGAPQELTVDQAMNEQVSLQQMQDQPDRVSGAMDILQHVLQNAEMVDMYGFMKIHNMLCEINNMAFTSEDAVNELFSALDRDGNRMLDYQEILLGMASFYAGDSSGSEEMGLSQQTFVETQQLVQNCEVELNLSQCQTIFRQLNSSIPLEDQQKDAEVVDAAVVTVFNFLDRNNNQRMDFNEIYAGLMLLMGAKDDNLTDQVAQVAFRMFDINNDQRIQFQELVHWFTTSYVILDVFQDNVQQQQMAQKNARDTAIFCFQECGQDLETGGLNFQQFRERFRR